MKLNEEEGSGGEGVVSTACEGSQKKVGRGCDNRRFVCLKDI